MRTIESIDDFNKTIKKHKKVFFKFFTPTCHPCKVIHPFIENLEKNNKNIHFYLVDGSLVNTNEIFEHFNIQSVPSFVIIDTEKYLGKVTGINYDEILELVKKLN